MTHSLSHLPLPQIDYIHTHTNHFFPSGDFVPTAELSSQSKYIPTEMQQTFQPLPVSLCTFQAFKAWGSKTFTANLGNPEVYIDISFFLYFFFIMSKWNNLCSAESKYGSFWEGQKFKKENCFLHLAASFNNTDKEIWMGEQLCRYSSRRDESTGLKFFNSLIYDSLSSTRFWPYPLQGTLPQILTSSKWEKARRNKHFLLSSSTPTEQIVPKAHFTLQPLGKHVPDTQDVTMQITALSQACRLTMPSFKIPFLLTDINQASKLTPWNQNFTWPQKVVVFGWGFFCFF